MANRSSFLLGGRCIARNLIFKPFCCLPAQSTSRLQDDRTAVTAGMAGMRQGFIVAGHFLLQTMLQCTDCSAAAYLASLPPAPHRIVYAVFAKTPSGFRFGFTGPDCGHLVCSRSTTTVSTRPAKSTNAKFPVRFPDSRKRPAGQLPVSSAAC